MARGLRIGSKAEVLKNLRSLLRVTRERSTEKSYRDCQWSQHVLTQFRERQHETNRDKMRAFRSEASDLLMMLEGVKEQKYLWDLDAGVDTKLTGEEVVNRSARRVGLSVPDSYTNDPEQLRKENEDKDARARAAAAKYLAAKKSKEAKDAKQAENH